MANYPPFFYLPSAAGILLGREFGMSILQTLVLSRIFTGTSAVALAALAITIAGGAAPWIFTLLMLPMPLSLMASASQDALLHASAALAAALLVRGIRWPAAGNDKLLAGLIVALALVAMARPPFGVLALLPLGLPRVQLWRRLLGSSAVVLCTLGWASIVAATSLSNFGSIVGADPTAQMQWIRREPLSALAAIFAAMTQMWRGYLTEFIGILGWLDTRLPIYYYRAAKAMLVIAAVAAMLGTNGRRMTLRNYLPIVSGIVLASIAVFLVQYLAWTVPSSATVEGIEGRYFFAPALAAAALLPSLSRMRAPRLEAALLVLICVFPIFSFGATMRAVILRYYLG